MTATSANMLWQTIYGRDPDQKQEWIVAIRRDPQWVPGTHCRVCSVHFDTSDFKISESGRRILHKDAIPSNNLYQEERQDTGAGRRSARRTRTKPKEDEVEDVEEMAGLDSGELAACRACLATGVPLRALRRRPFIDLVGTQVSPSDGLPQHLCAMCDALLRKFAKFRKKCRFAQDLMDEVRGGEPLTTDTIRTIDRKTNKLTHHLAVTQLEIIDLTEIIIKQEHLDLADDHEDMSADDVFDMFEEKDSEQKLFDNDVKLESENASHTEVYSSVVAKHEIFVDVSETGRERKRKSEKKERKKKKEPKVKVVEGRKTKPRKTDEDYDIFAKTYNVDIMFLSREEQIAEVQARRESDNYKNSRFKCEECYKGFTGEGAFKNHQATHDPSAGSYVCEPCGSRFPKRRQLLHHLTQHKMNLVCKLCNHVTKLLSKAKEHFKWHNGVKYPCHYCDKSFIKRTSQFNHMRNRHGSTSCDICQEIFSGERGLAAHMQKAHKEAVKSRCDTCGVQFYTEAALTRHLETLPGLVCQNIMRSCAECGDNFLSEEVLNEHKKENHWKEIKCEKCNANFENEKLYKMHRIIHKEFRNRRPRSELAKLGKSKPSSPARGKVKKVAKIQKRMCEMCGLTWRSSAALKYHQRVHTGEKPHQCPMCPKSFRIQDSLQIHLNTHTGARPFKCPHCPKAFKSRTQNHKHQLVHTKVRRYRCDLCDKTFQTSTCVKTHIRTVHMKIPAPPRARRRPPAWAGEGDAGAQ